MRSLLIVPVMCYLLSQGVLAQPDGTAEMGHISIGTPLTEAYQTWGFFRTKKPERLLFELSNDHWAFKGFKLWGLCEFKVHDGSVTELAGYSANLQGLAAPIEAGMTALELSEIGLRVPDETVGQPPDFSQKWKLSGQSLTLTFVDNKVAYVTISGQAE